MNEPRVESARAWLKKAQQDLAASEWLLLRAIPLTAPAAFHAQQAAEKTIKAYLAWREQPFGKTHSLVALIGQCLAFDEDFDQLREAATILTPYAVDVRYPGDILELSREEGEEALSLAVEVWDFVLSRLPKEAHPELNANPGDSATLTR